MTRIYFVAGEASGDIHGANLIRELRALDPNCFCEGLGGHRMAEAGMTLHYDLAERAIMGFTEVVRSIGMIRRLFHDTLARLTDARPDCLVLIDYPGFNIRLAKRARALGIPVVYYISPQIWAWKKGRIHTLARTVTKMLVILPFEKALYEKVGLDCAYVGHPLLDHIRTIPIEGAYQNQLVIGILPGSREQEIRRILPAMLEVTQDLRERYPHARFVAPCVDAVREIQIRTIAGAFPLETAVGKAYEVLAATRLCLVASGTATLETALFGVPMLILYKVSPVSFWIARALVDIQHIGLVNILAGKRVVPEYIQHQVRTDEIVREALQLIEESPRRAQMIRDLEAVRESLGGPGASRRAAESVLAVAQGKDGV